jgi:hypothetical protein
VERAELTNQVGNAPWTRRHHRGHRVAWCSLHDLHRRVADLTGCKQRDHVRGWVAVICAPRLQTGLSLDQRKAFGHWRYAGHDRCPLGWKTYTRETQRVDPEIEPAADPRGRFRVCHLTVEPITQPLPNPTRQHLRRRGDTDRLTIDTTSKPLHARCADTSHIAAKPKTCAKRSTTRSDSSVTPAF